MTSGQIKECVEAIENAIQWVDDIDNEFDDAHWHIMDMIQEAISILDDAKCELNMATPDDEDEE